MAYLERIFVSIKCKSNGFLSLILELVSVMAIDTLAMGMTIFSTAKAFTVKFETFTL